MPFCFRKRLTVIPGVLFANVSRAGISWTVRLWRWSWNSRSRRHTIDTPGPGYWQSSSQRRTPHRRSDTRSTTRR